MNKGIPYNQVLHSYLILETKKDNQFWGVWPRLPVPPMRAAGIGGKIKDKVNTNFQSIKAGVSFRFH